MANSSWSQRGRDLSDIYIKDQFIRGIANNALQTDLTTKSRGDKVSQAEHL